MVKRLSLILIGAFLLTLAMSSLAFAATSQDIYNDLADNGKLDGSYTCQELKTAVGDATINQYGDQTVIDDLRQIYNKQCRGEFPFTGFQLALAAVVAVALIAGGFAIRFFTRSRKPQKQ